MVRQGRAKKIRIEELAPEDVAAGDISELVALFGKESGLQEQFNAPLNLPHFVDTLAKFLETGHATVLAAFQGVNVVGVLVFMTTPHVFTGKISAQELVWYVHPEFRGTTTGPRLLKRFEDLAAEQGAELLIMVHLKNSMPERLKKFYEKRGYSETETAYMKRI